MLQRALVASSLLLLACDHGASPDAHGPGARAVVDASTVAACVVAYQCSLSHPGLGSTFEETSVDLKTCTKTVSSESGPFAPGRDAATSRSRRDVALAPEACARLRSLVLAVTADDARAESEAAQFDTMACALTLSCPPDPGRPVLSVQRQSLSGPGRVARVIRALQAPP